MAMGSEARLALAFRLGDEDLETYRAASGVSREQALRTLRSRRQVGRQPCSFLDRPP